MLTNDLLGQACLEQVAQTEKAADRVLAAIDNALSAQQSLISTMDRIIADLRSKSI